MDDQDPGRRQAWQEGPVAPVEAGWLALDDDELLYRIEAPPAGPATDAALLEVVRSKRHFFIRQEAAKKIGEVRLLKEHSADRHIGQILVRGMTRREDIELPPEARGRDAPPRGAQGRRSPAPAPRRQPLSGAGVAENGLHLRPRSRATVSRGSSG